MAAVATAALGTKDGGREAQTPTKPEETDIWAARRGGREKDREKDREKEWEKERDGRGTNLNCSVRRELCILHRKMNRSSAVRQEKQSTTHSRVRNRDSGTLSWD